MGRPPKPKPTPPKPNDIATKAAPFIDRIETLLAEKKVHCDGIKEDIDIVYGEAEGQGIAPKALKKIIRRRKLEADLAALPEKLDMDEAAQFAALAAAFTGTPFGDFALRVASLKADGVTMTVHGGAPDVPPVDPIEAENREDEDFLNKVGRGRH